MNCFTLIFLSVIASSLGEHINNFPTTRILGGVEVEPHSIPYQVGIFSPREDSSTVFCGGSLIKRNVVLTAADCVDWASGPNTIVLGAHKIFEAEDTQKVFNSSNVILHPNWVHGYISNNIALIILPEEVELNDNIQLVKLPSSDLEDIAHVNAVASGWGEFNDNYPNSPVLMATNITFMTNPECEAYFQGLIKFKESEICILPFSGNNICDGDLGGPITIDGVQVGIGFISNLQCTIDSPSVATVVSKFVDWIEENIPKSS